MRSKPTMVLIGLVVAATLLFSGSGVVAAQDGGGSVSPQVDPPCNGTVAPPSSGVLCSQMDSPAGGSAVVVSQNFESLDALCASVGKPPQCVDNQAADDFVVPSGGGVAAWIVDKVEVIGAYEEPGSYQVDSVNVQFYRNSGSGLPGTPVYQATYIPEAASRASGSFAINLTAPALLRVGAAYWLSVQANLNMNYPAETRYWRWASRSVQSNNGAAWQNPLDGWLLGSICMTWNVITTCTTTTDPDLLFKLSGHTTTTVFDVFLPLIHR